MTTVFVSLAIFALLVFPTQSSVVRGSFDSNQNSNGPTGVKPAKGNFGGSSGGQVGEKGSQGGNEPTSYEYPEVVLFQVAASGLPNTDVFGGEPDPYILISVGTPGSYEHLVRTGTLKNTHEAIWSQTIKFDKYSRGSQQILRFEIWDHDSVGVDDKIGYAYINIDDCVRQARRTPTEQPACAAQISGGNGLLHVTIL